MIHKIFINIISIISIKTHFMDMIYRGIITIKIIIYLYLQISKYLEARNRE